MNSKVLKSSLFRLASIISGIGLMLALMDNSGRVMATAGPETHWSPDKMRAARQSSATGAISAAMFNATLCGSVGFFQPPGSPFDIGGSVTSAASADFNLDGKPDLALGDGGNFFSPRNTVNILLGDGSGGFAPSSASPVTIGDGAYSMTVADFNRDGKPDIATADIFSSTTSVLLGDGAGGFAHVTGSPILISDIYPSAVVAGDWNEDGNPDLAISSVIFGTSRVAIMLGDGTGGFAAASGSPVELPFGWVPIDIVMGDFNLDGKPDLVTANSSGHNVATLIGDGNAGFTLIGGPVLTAQALRTVEVGDFNLDGRPDVSVTAIQGFFGETGHLIVLLGDGQGQFAPATGSPYPTGDVPYGQVIDDFNLDGYPDIAFSNDGIANNVKVIVGDGTGQFYTPPNSLFGVVGLPYAITGGDFNLDGRPDLAVGAFAQGSTTILLNSRPVVKCRDVWVAADPSCNASASIDDGSFDPDGDAITLSQSPPGPYPKGTTTVTLTVTDSTGASACCMATVTVYDAQAPTFNSCYGGIFTTTEPNDCSAIVTYTKPAASDNCGTVTVNCNPVPGATFPKGTTTVVCTATDTSNNQTGCSFTITVNDTQPPSLSCPSNLIRSTDPDQCSAVVNYPMPTASDNCPGIVLVCSPPRGSTFPKGVTTINCTATDSSNNSTACSFTITVEDDQPPAIACPANMTITTIRPGDASIVVNYAAPASSDNCAVASVVCSPASGSVFPLGVTTVSCLARDDTGNKAGCSFTVTVFDNCLQDDSNRGAVLLFNSSTGDYRFCYTGGMLTGKGIVTRKGNVFNLVDSKPDRRVQASLDAGARRGSASLQSPPGQIKCAIADRDVLNNNCSCGAGG